MTRTHKPDIRRQSVIIGIATVALLAGACGPSNRAVPTSSSPAADPAVAPAADSVPEFALPSSTMISDIVVFTEQLPEGADVRVEDKGVVIVLPESVLFGTGEYGLTNEALETLEVVVSYVEADYPGCDLLVEGHADSTGTDEFNAWLSERRAQSVADWLINHGIAASRITVAGHGSSCPIASELNADGSVSLEGRRRNRRVEITVLTSVAVGTP